MTHPRTRRFGTSLAVLTLASAFCVPAPAQASPPTPLVTKIDDLARAQTLEGGYLPTPAGTGGVSSIYTLLPGSSSGWTEQKGTTVLAVTAGALTLRTATGCATKQYTAGQAAVVPAGKYLVENASTQPLEFAGIFAKLPKAAAKPLVGSTAGAPTSCKSVDGFKAASVTSPELTEFVRGTFVPRSAYGHSAVHGKNSGGITIEPNTDMLVGSYSFLPGFSTGWVTHRPAIAFMTKGTFSYYEAKDGGGCVKTEEYKPGQAYTHVGGLHMGVNESTEAAEMIVIYFNLPHGGHKDVPVFGNTMDAINFLEAPPMECPRLS